METAIPECLLTEDNRQVLAHLSPLSCHSDIAQPLAAKLEWYPGVNFFCPDRAQYRYCCWYVGVKIFAFATGMQNVHLRLPDHAETDAVSSGATPCAAAGEGWFSLVWNSGHVGRWAGVAYNHANC
jgi:hypothetical protein